VAVNCAAISDSLFEAELFGHSRGAFTGAERARAGLLAEAEGGTLLLDEIGELSLARQATLLRLLESGRYRPVGADKESSSDARIVAATNRDLEQAVSAGQFRRDLLYRINALEVVIPPLRTRSDDIALLAEVFLQRGNPESEISSSALDALSAYDWPGNVRELAHLIERLLAHGARRIELEDLPRVFRRGAPLKIQSPPSDSSGRALSERDEVAAALSRCNGNISQTARALGLSRHGLKKKMLRLGLRSVEKNGA
jgi:transcriptional regulator with PAS, ATPase and Fis domain